MEMSMECAVCGVEDVGGEARVFRAQIVDWVKRYAQTCRRAGGRAVSETDAHAELRRWSRHYFKPARSPGTCQG
jgi:hypothetical protein